MYGQRNAEMGQHVSYNAFLVSPDKLPHHMYQVSAYFFGEESNNSESSAGQRF